MNKASGKEVQDNYNLLTDIWEDRHLQRQAFERSNETLDDSITKMTTCLTSRGEGSASRMRMLAVALASLRATPGPGMHYAQQSYTPHKFGGKWRQIAINLEELETFKPIRPDNSKDTEIFADLLDIAVINLKEAGRIEDLEDGSLYLKLQKKMTEAML